MNHKFKIPDQEAVHFVTFTTIHWLDRAKARQVFLFDRYIEMFFWKAFASAKKQRTGITCTLYDEQPRTHDRCQAWQTKLGSCLPRHKKNILRKLIERIRDNDQGKQKRIISFAL